MPTIPIDRVRVGRRHRGLAAERVDALAASIAEIGLQTPISVFPTEHFEGGADRPVFELVAGLHRLEACKLLGRTEIEATLVSLGEVERELWEIDENLMRAELTQLQRAEHLARRKDLFDLQTGASCASLGGRGKVAFGRDAETKTGIDKATINRSVRRAVRIDERVKARIRDTPIADSGVELDALASLDAPEQRRALRLVETGKAASIRDARRQLHTGVERTYQSDGDERQLKALQQAWNRASAAARKAFTDWLADVEPAVFDRGRGAA